MISQSIQSCSVQFSSVTQSCPTLCDPMNCSRPGLLVHYQLPEFTQTHVHRVGDAIQPSRSLSSPSLPALNPSQHQIFSNESTLRIRWPKYWSFSFSIISTGRCRISNDQNMTFYISTCKVKSICVCTDFRGSSLL